MGNFPRGISLLCGLMSTSAIIVCLKILLHYSVCHLLHNTCTMLQTIVEMSIYEAYFICTFIHPLPASICLTGDTISKITVELQWLEH